MEKSKADLQTLLSETQRSLTDTEAELSSARAELSDTQASLAKTRSELSDTLASLDELRASSVTDVQRLEKELNLTWADRDAAARQYMHLLLTNSTHCQHVFFFYISVN